MGENRKIYAALLGAGTVGSGVYKLAGMQEEDICLKTGAQQAMPSSRQDWMHRDAITFLCRLQLMKA